MKRPVHIYTPEQKLWLKWHSALPRVELAKMFNERFGADITVDMMKAACLRFGFKTGRTGCFEKGHVPDPRSLRKKGDIYSGTFKSGHRPANWLPVGSEVTDDDGYIKVKVADPNAWRFKHYIVWEEANGRQVPKGMVLRLRDGDKTNVAPENIVLITKAEHIHLMRRDYDETPAELKAITMTAIRLEAAIFKRLRDI